MKRSEDDMPTLAGKMERDVERLRQAMHGRVFAGYDEDGEEMYDAASPEACEGVAVKLLEDWYCKANRLAACGRALERIMADHGWRYKPRELYAVMDEEVRRYDTYAYSFEVEEMLDEAEGVR